MIPTRSRLRAVVWLTVALAVVACAGRDPAQGPPPPLHPSVDGYPAATVVLVGPGGERVPVAVRVAATAQHRQHGLMEVPVLPDGVGMLFVFGEQRPADAGFWMKDTLVALDIVYLDEDGRPVAVLAMEPCPELPCPSYPPGAPYRYTLEVRQGFLGDLGFDHDWRVELPEDVSGTAAPAHDGGRPS